jgi:hypothetical protein
MMVVDADQLVARNEGGGVGSCVGLDLGWGEGGAGGRQGRGVVGKIRFPLMAEEYLRDCGSLCVKGIGSGRFEWWLMRCGPRRRGGRVRRSNSSCWGGWRWRIVWG